MERVLVDGNQALVLLLLSNGCNPDLEAVSPWRIALESRRKDLIQLLLEWGADPHRIDPMDVFDTYDSSLMQLFLDLGVNLCRDHSLARTLTKHTSNKPLFGFARRHRAEFPAFQRELDIALAHHAGDGSEKGVSLCLWAGGDPHKRVPSIRFWRPERGDERDQEEACITAIEEACRYGNPKILEMLRPDPQMDDLDELYRIADNGAVVDVLGRFGLPQAVGPIISTYLWWQTSGFSEWRSSEILRRLFAVGARWRTDTPEEIARIRQLLYKLSDYEFVEALQLFSEDDHVSSEVLAELARTPTFRKRLKKVGFIPSTPGESDGARAPQPRSAKKTREKLGVRAKPKRKKRIPLPQTVQLGQRRDHIREVRFDRSTLFELVWTRPVREVAKEFGMSDVGLAKGLRQLQIPTPPRGYWAKVRAGQKTRRPTLRDLPPGEAEEIVIRIPGE